MGKLYLFNVYTFCKSLCVINEGSPYGLHWVPIYIAYLYDHMWLVGLWCADGNYPHCVRLTRILLCDVLMHGNYPHCVWRVHVYCFVVCWWKFPSLCEAFTYITLWCADGFFPHCVRRTLILLCNCRRWGVEYTYINLCFFIDIVRH